VSEASVAVEGERIAAIGHGVLVLLGVARGDTSEQAEAMVRKLRALRIFEDDSQRMNLSVEDVGGEVLCVSQFTLLGDTRKGNRPSFVEAAPAGEAEALYGLVRDGLGAHGGRFGALMEVALTNHGPVTLIVEV
jgi:D-tyrosyl-tRNA(Tyr) deacylase